MIASEITFTKVEMKCMLALQAFNNETNYTVSLTIKDPDLKNMKQLHFEN